MQGNSSCKVCQPALSAAQRAGTALRTPRVDYLTVHPESVCVELRRQG